MRAGLLALAIVLTSCAAAAAGQQEASSAGQAAQAPANSAPGGQPQPPAIAAPDLPVSLERIRKGLEAQGSSLTLRFTKEPDFKSQVKEQQRLSEIVAGLDFRAGPTPPGGLYYYEQQRLIWNPIDHPLMQPYAAFNTGEMVTLAIENLVRSSVEGPILDAISGARRAHAEAAAREEVVRAIAEYCAAQPHRGSGILICEKPSFAR